MIKISQLLTGKVNGVQKMNTASIEKQQLAVATALQILNEFPKKRKSPKDWEKYNSLRGVLLADEVGCGKTFEALAIISKAFLDKVKSKQKRFRVLIIAAPAIRSKWEWKQESEKEKWCDLKEFIVQTNLSQNLKNNLEVLFKTAEANKKRKIEKDEKRYFVTSKSQWKHISKFIKSHKQKQGIWITSFGNLPVTVGRSPHYFQKKYGFPSGSFDYIIADEAHIVKSGYNDSEQNLSSSINNSAIRKIYGIQNENPKAKLLLLTATPFQNNLNEFIHMISLVEKNNDLDYSIAKIIEKGLIKLFDEIALLKTGTGISKEKIHQLINCFDNEVGELIGEENGKTKRPKEIRTEGRENGLDDFLRDVMIRNNKDPLDIVPCDCNLNEAEKLQYLLFRDIITQKTEAEKEMFPIKLSQLVSSDDAFSNSLRDGRKQKHSAIKKLFGNKNLLFEKKYDALLKKIFEINISDKKVIVVFTDHLKTITILKARLEKKFTVHRMDGETIKVKDRKTFLNNLVSENQKSSNKIILLVSRVGTEGLDFNDFSNTVLHFDGHYNPAMIDQRNGRVYRGKTKPKDISVEHIYLKETYDQKIKTIELEKRKLKNFFLGDTSLHDIIVSILSKEDIQEKKELLKELKKIKFDFQPQEKYLLPSVKKLLR